MKDFNKDKFNDSVSRKFSGAEVQPGNNVWEGIEAELLKQDNLKMQKRAVFYRNLAASVILIALVSIYFNFQDFTSGSRQTSSSPFNPIELNNGFLTETEAKSDRKGKIALMRPVTKTDKGQNEKGTTVAEKESNVISDVAIDRKSELASIIKFDNDVNPAFEALVNDNESPSEIASFHKVDNKKPAKAYLARTKIEVKPVSYFAVSALDQEKESSGLAWNTNVNLGSGNFNPNSEITETPVFSTVSTLNNPGTSARTTGADAIADNQEREAVETLSSEPMQSNISFTVGLNVGVLLNEKWNIKTGLQYGAYRSTSSSSTVLRDRNSDELFPYHGASSSTEVSDGRVINVISEYELYNDFQIVTIPLMVSYKVIDRKFDVALVGGLSADYIINNTLKGGSDQINKITFNQNDQQAYKNLFASGMAGIEISYPFANKYAISVMPTYKKALSNITNRDANFKSVPAFMGLNMSLAYMF